MEKIEVFTRNRVVLLAMAAVARADRLPEGVWPDLDSVKAMLMSDGHTEVQANELLEAAISDGLIEIGEKEVALL